MSSYCKYEFILKRVNFPGVIVLNKQGNTYTCGRGKQNHIICLSLTVSREHCMFFCNNDELYVTDLKSANGIYINGIQQATLKTVKLSQNDVIGIGCPHTNPTDSTMYAYKLDVVKLQNSEIQEDISNVTQSILSTNDMSTNVALEENASIIPKRKRDKRVSDRVVPNKIPKLGNEVGQISSEDIQLSNDCKWQDDNDIEILHVSLNSRTSVQSCSNNNKNVTEHFKTSDVVVLNTSTSNGKVEKNENMERTKQIETLVNNEEKIQFGNIDQRKSTVLSNIDNTLKTSVNSSIVSKQIGPPSGKIKHPDKLNKKCEGDLPHTQDSPLKKGEKCTNILYDSNNSSNTKCAMKSECGNVILEPKKGNVKRYSKEALNVPIEKEPPQLNAPRIANHPVDENDMFENTTYLPENFLHNGNHLIKLESELQLTDTDEDAILNSISDSNACVSPIKLRKIRQEPRTRFSEVDVVNLSDDEDDIFPCSQLFDAKFGMDVSPKKEIKEEPNDIDDESRFCRLDDAELIISDSDEEDNTWLHRLSRSQILNENDETDTSTKKEHTEDTVIGIIDPKSNADICETKPIEACIDTRKKDDENAEQHHMHKMQDTLHHLHITVERMDVNDLVEDVLHKETNDSKEHLSPRITKQNEMRNNTDVLDTGINERIASLSKRSSVQKKVPEIEPPRLSTGRRRSSLHSKTKELSSTSKPTVEEKKKVQDKGASENITGLKLTTKEKKDLQARVKIEEHEYNKEQKHRKMLHKWADCLPPSKKKVDSKDSTLTKEQKKSLIDDRKEKLKKIALEEKRLSLEENQGKKRGVIKPKAKVSAKNRGDFLLTEQTTPSTLKQDVVLPKTKNSETKVASPQSSKPTEKMNKNITKKDSYTDIMNVVTGTMLDSLRLTDASKKHRIPKKNCDANREKTTDISKKPLQEETYGRKKKVNKSVTTTASKEVTDKLMTEPLVPMQKKSLLCDNKMAKSVPITKKKNRVTFAENIHAIRVYEIDSHNSLNKIVGKDAPIPIDKLPVKVRQNIATEISPKLEEFLIRILMWNPVWLEEQQHLDSIAPVVPESELRPMLTRFKSYNEYYRIIAPLLLLEIWCGITKEFQTIEQNFRRPTLMCSIVENSIGQYNVPSTNISLTTLLLEVLATRDDIRRQAHPNSGDLVFFEYAENKGRGQTFRKVFAYVTNVFQTVLKPFTHYNKDLNNYVKNPYMLITYTVQTKPLVNNIPVNRVQRLRAVTYLRPNLRMVQALHYLPTSPLMNPILNPRIDIYQLSSVPCTKPQTCSLITKDILNPKQLEAVLNVTESVVQKEAKLCFIQGPPGTGKSKVIVNIITQVLYGNDRYTDIGGSLRILVCAPSNAAIDEIALRLLAIRATLKQKRFKMVRIGRPEMMHPTVRDISVTELAKRDIKRTASNYSKTTTDSVDEEKLFLEAKMNALKCEISSSYNIDETYKKNIQMKLADVAARYELLRNLRPLDEIDPRELARLQRAAENRLLMHADIITCTLSSCYTSQMESVFGSSTKKISVCIVDEATQSTEAETLIPLMLGVKTLVLVGDPNQLPATVLSQQAKKLGLDRSIFGRVQSAFEGEPQNPIIMLDTQYRMQYDISYWPNKFFYGGKLKNAPKCCLTFPFHAYRILDLNTNQNKDKFTNTDEAEFVANMISCMLTLSNFNKWPSCISLGVLTPYNNQRTLILQKIEEKLSIIPENIKKKMTIEVNTVDSFQGQERDIVIMSCVRSHGIGFLSDRQRLCVALTRAKHSLILCGNFYSFMRDQMWSALLLDGRSRGIYFTVNANSKPHEIKSLVVKNAK